MAENSEVIIISGGSRGLGAALVEKLLGIGYIVATFSRSQTAFTDKCSAQYTEKQFYWKSVDAKNSSDIRNFVKKTAEKYGHINGLINNAGIHIEGILTTHSDVEIDNLLNINLKGAISLTQACLKYMLVQNQGNIIMISSVIGTRGFKGLTVYGASKAALDGFTKGLAREYGRYNIRVNAIAPGYLETDMTNSLNKAKINQIIRRTPLKRLGKVEDITGIVNFLLSKDATFITGQTIIADGGLTC